MKNLVNENLDDFLYESKRLSKKENKFYKVMSHWKEGKQHIGKSKKTVPHTKEGQKQALAIAFSETGKSAKTKKRK